MNGSVEKDGNGKKVKKEQGRSRRKTRTQGRGFQERRVPGRLGKVSTESFALATWWPLVISAKVMGLRSEGK